MSSAPATRPPRPGGRRHARRGPGRPRRCGRPGDPARLVDAAVDRFGALHILVANAGGPPPPAPSSSTTTPSRRPSRPTCSAPSAWSAPPFPDARGRLGPDLSDHLQGGEGADPDPGPLQHRPRRPVGLGQDRSRRPVRRADHPQPGLPRHPRHRPRPRDRDDARGPVGDPADFGKVVLPVLGAGRVHQRHRHPGRRRHHRRPAGTGGAMPTPPADRHRRRDRLGQRRSRHRRALELGVETRGSTPAWTAAAAPSTRSWRPSTPRGSSRPAAPAAA